MSKKGLSPLIATVLLIAFAVGVASMVLVWGRGFFVDFMEQQGGEAEDALACLQEVKFVSLGGIVDVLPTGDKVVNVTVINIGTANVTNATITVEDNNGAIALVTNVEIGQGSAGYLTDSGNGVDETSLKQAQVVWGSGCVIVKSY